MKRKTRTSDEILGMLRPGMSLPEVLIHTAKITDINVEILDVGKPEGKGQRPVRFLHLCCDPPREDVKDMEYIRKRMRKKGAECRQCCKPFADVNVSRRLVRLKHAKMAKAYQMEIVPLWRMKRFVTKWNNAVMRKSA